MNFLKKSIEIVWFFLVEKIFWKNPKIFRKIWKIFRLVRSRFSKINFFSEKSKNFRKISNFFFDFFSKYFFEEKKSKFFDGIFFKSSSKNSGESIASDFRAIPALQRSQLPILRKTLLSLEYPYGIGTPGAHVAARSGIFAFGPVLQNFVHYDRVRHHAPFRAFWVAQTLCKNRSETDF